MLMDVSAFIVHNLTWFIFTKLESKPGLFLFEFLHNLNLDTVHTRYKTQTTYLPHSELLVNKNK